MEGRLGILLQECEQLQQGSLPFDAHDLKQRRLRKLAQLQQIPVVESDEKRNPDHENSWQKRLFNHFSKRKDALQIIRHKVSSLLSQSVMERLAEEYMDSAVRLKRFETMNSFQPNDVLRYLEWCDFEYMTTSRAQRFLIRLKWLPHSFRYNLGIEKPKNFLNSNAGPLYLTLDDEIRDQNQLLLKRLGIHYDLKQDPAQMILLSTVQDAFDSIFCPFQNQTDSNPRFQPNPYLLEQEARLEQQNQCDLLLESEFRFLRLTDLKFIKERLESQSKSHQKRALNDEKDQPESLNVVLSNVFDPKVKCLDETHDELHAFYLLRDLSTRQCREKLLSFLQFHSSVRAEIETSFKMHEIDFYDDATAVPSTTELQESDLQTIEHELESIGTWFLNKSSCKIDRASVLYDLYESEVLYQTAKRQVIEQLMDIFASLVEMDHQKLVAKYITHELSKRPRIRLKDLYFKQSYAFEIAQLELELKFITTLKAFQAQEQHEFIKAREYESILPLQPIFSSYNIIATILDTIALILRSIEDFHQPEDSSEQAILHQTTWEAIESIWKFTSEEIETKPSYHSIFQQPFALASDLLIRKDQDGLHAVNLRETHRNIVQTLYETIVVQEIYERQRKAVENDSSMVSDKASFLSNDLMQHGKDYQRWAIDELDRSLMRKDMIETDWIEYYINTDGISLLQTALDVQKVELETFRTAVLYNWIFIDHIILSQRRDQTLLSCSSEYFFHVEEFKSEFKAKVKENHLEVYIESLRRSLVIYQHVVDLAENLRTARDLAGRIPLDMNPFTLDSGHSLVTSEGIVDDLFYLPHPSELMTMFSSKIQLGTGRYKPRYRCLREKEPIVEDLVHATSCLNRIYQILWTRSRASYAWTDTKYTICRLESFCADLDTLRVKLGAKMPLSIKDCASFVFEQSEMLSSTWRCCVMELLNHSSTRIANHFKIDGSSTAITELFSNSERNFVKKRWQKIQIQNETHLFQYERSLRLLMYLNIGINSTTMGNAEDLVKEHLLKQDIVEMETLRRSLLESSLEETQDPIVPVQIQHLQQDNRYLRQQMKASRVRIQQLEKELKKMQDEMEEKSKIAATDQTFDIIAKIGHLQQQNTVLHERLENQRLEIQERVELKYKAKLEASEMKIIALESQKKEMKIREGMNLQSELNGIKSETIDVAMSTGSGSMRLKSEFLESMNTRGGGSVANESLKLSFVKLKSMYELREKVLTQYFENQMGNVKIQLNKTRESLKHEFLMEKSLKQTREQLIHQQKTITSLQHKYQVALHQLEANKLAKVKLIAAKVKYEREMKDKLPSTREIVECSKKQPQVEKRQCCCEFESKIQMEKMAREIKKLRQQLTRESLLKTTAIQHTAQLRQQLDGKDRAFSPMTKPRPPSRPTKPCSSSLRPQSAVTRRKATVGLIVKGTVRPITARERPWFI